MNTKLDQNKILHKLSDKYSRLGIFVKVFVFTLLVKIKSKKLVPEIREKAISKKERKLQLLQPTLM